MAKTASLNIRLDPNLKRAAESVYSRYGLSLAEAVTVFIHQSCNVGGLPFDLRPLRFNTETLAAMAEAERIRLLQKRRDTALTIVKRQRRAEEMIGKVDSKICVLFIIRVLCLLW